MSLPSITLDQQHAVNELRRLGRTDRQIEKIVGLRYGVLSKTYRVDCSAQIELACDERAFAERSKKNRRLWAANDLPDRNLRGWRPQGDCVTARSNLAPLQSPTRNMNDRGTA